MPFQQVIHICFKKKLSVQKKGWGGAATKFLVDFKEKVD
jgi:hypothetical protein